MLASYNDIPLLCDIFGSGFYKQSSRRGLIQNGKDADGSLNLGEAKPLKRGNFPGHGSQEVRLLILPGPFCS